ncbi:hypothetical protein [Candidatus Berkiella aquae]|uniref:Uncharacterized protein n=1 Tax=Candidatus Berkiella aquae TaxID=295108 RepID=A0A0Q9YNM8_9GAMM|nr:hypothetical protein [Candidatus Berkiella aquae]MCS5711677.1 hypothetical protein [Candidatus Berkiella aquae]
MQGQRELQLQVAEPAEKADLDKLNAQAFEQWMRQCVTAFIKNNADYIADLAKNDPGAMGAGGYPSGVTAEQIFGIEEQYLKDKIAEFLKNNEIKLQHATTEELKRKFTKVNKANKNADKPVLKIITGVRANEIQNGKLENDIVVVASQLNHEESQSALRTESILGWVKDRTQGPDACLAALVDSYIRAMANRTQKVPDSLENILIQGGFAVEKNGKPEIPFYKNGYLMADRIPKDKKSREKLLKVLDKMDMPFLAQNCQCERTGHNQIQMFVGAVSYQSVTTNQLAKNPVGGPERKLDWDLLKQKYPDDYKFHLELQRRVLFPQFKAIAHQAALLAEQKPNEMINLNLNAVGRGSFNNQPEIIIEAYQEALNILKGYPNVNVIVHAFDENAKKHFEKDFNDKGIQYTTVKDFDALKALPKPDQSTTKAVPEKEKKTKQSRRKQAVETFSSGLEEARKRISRISVPNLSINSVLAGLNLQKKKTPDVDIEAERKRKVENTIQNIQKAIDNNQITAAESGNDELKRLRQQLYGKELTEVNVKIIDFDKRIEKLNNEINKPPSNQLPPLPPEATLSSKPLTMPAALKPIPPKQSPTITLHNEQSNQPSNFLIHLNQFVKANNFEHISALLNLAAFHKEAGAHQNKHWMPKNSELPMINSLLAKAAINAAMYDLANLTAAKPILEDLKAKCAHYEKAYPEKQEKEDAEINKILNEHKMQDLNSFESAVRLQKSTEKTKSETPQEVSPTVKTKPTT